MKKKSSEEKKLLDMENVTVVHLNADRGYISYLEESEEGKYKVKGILLNSDEEKEEE
jgi:hypothetical protein